MAMASASSKGRTFGAAMGSARMWIMMMITVGTATTSAPKTVSDGNAVEGSAST